MDAWRADFADNLRFLLPLAPRLDWLVGRSTWPTAAELTQVATDLTLTNAVGLPLQFVAAVPKVRRAKRPLDELSYEERVFRLGCVATRAASWHDLFNALAWMAFPRAKAALNQRQVEGGAGHGRTREQDRLAMMDEGGVILFGDDRFVLGHALCEAAVRGEHFVQGMAYPVSVGDHFAGGDVTTRRAAADQLLAADILSLRLAAAPRLATVPLRDLI